ncbi:MAG: Asp-tRNA(Asn)/Glu-tRNA(Gln) amidotransferase subunit GatB [Bacteroidota bacterium]
MASYELVIGLEIHVQLATRSKAFSSDGIRFGDAPNQHTNPVSLGHPGTLPYLNQAQVESAVKLGMALGSQINNKAFFDRKNYFYTDLPKGYQITQDNLPICTGGEIPILVGKDHTERTIRIHHVHMEEDAGKSVHNQSAQHSLIDLNRAGVPLLEIVTEPDLRTAEEVDALMTAMRQLVRYLGISGGNMEQGQMRCDVNISLRKPGEPLGIRAEIKNINSMKYARQAIRYEFQRQAERLDQGLEIVQETRQFHPESGSTSSMRTKENAHDYRYFPEPDLPPLALSEEELQRIKAELPTLPWAWRSKLAEQYQLSTYDAGILTAQAETILFFEELAANYPNPKSVANLVINKILPWQQETQKALSDFPIPTKALWSFLDLVKNNRVSHSAAYQQLFPALLQDPAQRPAELAETLNLWQEADSNALQEMVLQVLAAHPDKVKAYQKGKKGLLGFFMGQVMQASKGKADPQQTNALLQGELEKS